MRAARSALRPRGGRQRMHSFHVDPVEHRLGSSRQGTRQSTQLAIDHRRTGLDGHVQEPGCDHDALPELPLLGVEGGRVAGVHEHVANPGRERRDRDQKVQPERIDQDRIGSNPAQVARQTQHERHAAVPRVRQIIKLRAGQASNTPRISVRAGSRLTTTCRSPGGELLMSSRQKLSMPPNLSPFTTCAITRGRSDIVRPRDRDILRTPPPSPRS